MKLFLSVALLFAVACTSVSVEKNALNTIATARSTMSSYVRFADVNRNSLPRDALLVAEEIRTSGADYLLSAHTALDRYVEADTPANKSRLDIVLDTIQSLTNEALKYMRNE